ncbi:MAG: MBL fold metallo-hydrolase [Treponema sp.]|nr:MBL fold metallo-hydrolase [Treponema sp.]
MKKLSACIFVFTLLCSIYAFDKGGNLSVHYIDVGQADAILIELPNSQTMLIDGGNRADGPALLNYLVDKGISTIDYLVATHPHEDHIGGLAAVINSTIKIESIYMPRVAANTQVFENLLSAIDDKGLSINAAQCGVSILSLPDLQIDIVSPVTFNSSDLNDWSAVIKLKYHDKVFLFMGDIEIYAADLISADIDADVIKIGHHGSALSVSASFLQRVSPDYALISVGESNNYGHPDDAALSLLQECGVTVFRTDQQGTIIISSDGEQLCVNQTPILYGINAPPVHNCAPALRR